MKKIIYIFCLTLLPLISNAQSTTTPGYNSDDYVPQENSIPLEATNDSNYNSYDYVPVDTSTTGRLPVGPGGSTGNVSAGPVNETRQGSVSQQTQFLQNPLKGVNSIGALVNQLVNLFTKILWIIAALALLWSGFMYIKAQGDPDAISEAHARFKNVLIGIAIIVGANTIASVVQDLVRSLNN